MSRAQVNPPCDEDPDKAAPAIDLANARLETKVALEKSCHGVPGFKRYVKRKFQST